MGYKFDAGVEFEEKNVVRCGRDVAMREQKGGTKDGEFYVNREDLMDH